MIWLFIAAGMVASLVSSALIGFLGLSDVAASTVSGLLGLVLGHLAIQAYIWWKS